MAPQMSIFQPQFDERIRRIEIDGVVYFSVLDVFTHYGKAKNATTSWKTVLNRLEKQGFDRSREILDRPVEAGGRPTPFATVKTMNRIAQVTEFKEWEYIRNWMAELAHERLEEMANPALGVERAVNRAELAYQKQGKDPLWIASRITGVDDRKAFTDSLVQHIIDLDPKRHFAESTNVIYKGLWGRDASQLREQIGITKKQSLRDHQTRLALHYQAIVESLIAFYLGEGEQMTWDAAKSIIADCANTIGVQTDQLAQRMGIDLATGKLLKERN